jgi:hypothetical protein
MPRTWQIGTVMAEPHVPLPAPPNSLRGTDSVGCWHGYALLHRNSGRTGRSGQITLVRIGVDLSGLMTAGDLRDGIQEADRLLGSAADSPGQPQHLRVPCRVSRVGRQVSYGRTGHLSITLEL